MWGIAGVREVINIDRVKNSSRAYYRDEGIASLQAWTLFILCY